MRRADACGGRPRRRGGRRGYNTLMERRTDSRLPRSFRCRIRAAVLAAWFLPGALAGLLAALLG